MKTTLLIIFGLAILAAAAAGPRRTAKGSAKLAVNDVTIKDAATDETPSSVKVALNVDDDDGISESLDELLDSDDEESGEIRIPSLEDLTTESNPVKLARKIKKVADKNTRRQLISALKNAKDTNKGTLPGRFYQAAYAAVSRQPEAERRAEQFWSKQLNNVVNQVVQPVEGAMSRTKTGLGDGVGTVERITAADPVGVALLNGESVLLTVLSDTFKNAGTISDMLYDGVKTGSQIVDAATFPADYIPIVRTAKKNVHSAIERGADRGKFVLGSMAENGSASLGAAAQDARMQAQDKENVLRQFSSKRTL